MCEQKNAYFTRGVNSHTVCDVCDPPYKGSHIHTHGCFTCVE